MKEIKKCLYCGKSFDISTEPFKKVGRRYIEEDCYTKYMEIQNSTKVNREKEISKYHEVLDWVRDHYTEPNYALIQQQLNEYISNGMKYESIYKTLRWYYEICGNEIKDEYGIGIVPLQFENAKMYYKRLWELEQLSNQPLTYTVEEVVIQPPERIPYRKKKFTFLDEKEGK